MRQNLEALAYNTTAILIMVHENEQRFNRLLAQRKMSTSLRRESVFNF